MFHYFGYGSNLNLTSLRAKKEIKRLLEGEGELHRLLTGDPQPPPDADWWRLHVFDQHGRPIANPANRFGFNAATIIDRPDGTFRIDVARDARPGNWLPVPRGGRLVVVLEILNRTGAAGALRERTRALPAISRVSCQ